MVKKLILGFVLFLILGIAFFFGIEYIRYRNNPDPDKIFLLPKLEFVSIEITSMNARAADMMIWVSLKNQLPFSFRADSLEYNCFIDNTDVLKSKSGQTLAIKANDTSTLKFPVRLNLDNLITTLNKDAREDIDSVDYRIAMSFIANVGIRKKFHVDVIRHLPLIYLPKVTAEHIHIRSLNFGRAEVELHVRIENKNKADLIACDVEYQFSIDGHEWVKGTIPGITTIKANVSSDITIPMRISFKQVRKTVFELLAKGEKVPYKLHLNLVVSSSNKMIRNSRLNVISEGSVKSLLQTEKAVKKDMKN